MHEDVKLISARIRELRQLLDLSCEEVADKLDIPAENYRRFEDGTQDIPISTLYEIASLLNIDCTVLLTGESPKMESQCVVRAGQGISVDRYPGYRFASLAYNYIDRDMEPLLVTLEPSGTPPSLVIHSGQEFNYVLCGKVKVIVGQREHLLETGDSIYFNPQLPHGQSAVDGPATFLTVIKES